MAEGGTKGHAITPTYTGLPTKAYVDTQIAAEREYEPLVTLTTAHAVDSTYRIANITNSNFLSTLF